MLWTLFNPPKVVKPKPDADANAVAEAEGGDAAGAEGDDPASGEEQGDQAPPAEQIVAPEVDSPPFVTLGSIDPDSPYRMAATFDTHGATIRRIQLASPKYRDLHDQSGFLGQLELTDSPTGVVIQSVTPGSPAALAGVEADDVLTSIQPAANSKMVGGDIKEVADFALAMAKSKPGEEVTVTVQRGGAAKTLTAKLIRRPLELIRPEQENIFLHSDKLPPEFEAHPSLEITISRIEPYNGTVQAFDKANAELVTGVWAVDDTVADQLTFSKVLPELGIEVVKRLKIAKDVSEEQATEDTNNEITYHFEFDVEIRNLLSTPQQVQYVLQGPNGLPIEGFWYASKVGRGWSGYGIRDVLMRTYGSAEKDFACRNIAKGKINPYGDGESLAYIGVDAQYFAATMVPLKQAVEERWYTTFTPVIASTKIDDKNSYQQKYQNSSFKLTSQMLELAAKDEAGSSKTHASTLFTGPKHPDLLAEYTLPAAPQQSLDDFVYYGYSGNLGIPQLMVGILNFFYSFLGNYGLAIFGLTVLARGLMTPLSRKQAKNMAMMQELRPEIDRIKERYKDDTQAQMKAQQELFAKHNYNPMGGCLLMFIQLPIFIGLYRALMVDVDLRQASLIPGLRWCSNLAAPDMLIDWSGMPWPQWFLNGEGMFALGPYLNILPLVTVSLFLLQQKMFMPPAADEQAEMMQKVTKFMMFFMGFMFFKVAAGLCLYFIASSIWGIAERKMIPRPEPPKTNVPKTSVSNKPKNSDRDSTANKKLATSKANKGGKKKR
ncbi:YidC/Oxa1 family insertase periplasmic-domain containing protein [Aeoliella mucimassa]|uniref:Membrane protein insertase YidC n=1 Tax=Aeoliella mucimassa TaxID=2527972 RepID=A0A518AST4_9BACT|nr:YidC/Oxa1 family insertase periplasmic-domain containing protein [Aeoliella mucimassa]QDU57788.1 Membrane protein insertase YidC [Aeoliella mucimassa]